MYSSLRHDSNIKESMLSNSASNLPDSSNTGRPFVSSFSGQSGSAPVFHHYGLHNAHGSYNIPSMPTALTSRNSGLGGVASSGVHQPSGNITSARFTSNTIQMSHGSLHGHSGIANRAGLGVSPLMGNATPRISSSVGNIAGAGGAGSSLARSLNSGGGLGVANLTSRVNLAHNNGSGNMSVQGPGRPVSGVLQHASPQVISLLGNAYSSSGGIPAQAQALNAQLGNMGLSNDGNSNEGLPFDINDFPQLSARQNSSGPQGQLVSLRKQGTGVNSLVQQNQEFSIQNEDFPALPVYNKGANVEFSMEPHQKDQQHDNAVAMMQPQHFIARSAGFPLGGSYASHRQPQQQQTAGITAGNGGASFAAGNPADLIHLHSSDLFPSSHGVAASYHSQVPGLRSAGVSNTTGLGSYDQLLQQYQNQAQFRLQQVPAVGQSSRDQGVKSMQGIQAPADKFGLMGLLNVIRMTDLDLTTLALGIDLTTLGLNLNSKENLYKTFGSPWFDTPPKGDPEYSLPQCYIQSNPPKLQQGHFSKFQMETLFYIFYSMPNDEAQLYAANELYNRGWFYHREKQLWFMRVPNLEPLVKTSTHERGSYLYFDPNTWETHRKDNFVVAYEMIENRPHLPQH